jgi:hypothetical protein
MSYTVLEEVSIEEEQEECLYPIVVNPRREQPVLQGHWGPPSNFEREMSFCMRQRMLAYLRYCRRWISTLPPGTRTIILLLTIPVILIAGLTLLGSCLFPSRRDNTQNGETVKDMPRHYEQCGGTQERDL